MLYGLVTESVLACFCRSCRAPVAATANRRNKAPSKKCKTPKKPDIRTKQPRKVQFLTTEIRCQEQSKGGLKYDVILADPAGTPPAPKRTQSPTRTKSVENIEEKLKAAEERRLSLEQSKVASIAAKLSKIEEVTKKKDEQMTVFINQTKEALGQKMETHTEKRDAYITEIKTKLKDHEKRAEMVRQNKKLSFDQEEQNTASSG